jgi:hypothetical protein
MVNIDESQWCSPCQEPYPKEECPRREEDSPDNMKFIDTNFVFQDENDDDEYVDVTQDNLMKSAKGEPKKVDSECLTN